MYVLQPHEACQKIANVPVERRKTNVMCELKTFNEIASSECVNAAMFSRPMLNASEDVESLHL